MNEQQIEIVDHELADVLRQKTEAERLRTAWGMWRSARNLLTQLIAAENKDLSDPEVQAEVSRRMASGT
jgi:hypothetical protein